MAVGRISLAPRWFASGGLAEVRAGGRGRRPWVSPASSLDYRFWRPCRGSVGPTFLPPLAGGPWLQVSPVKTMSTRHKKKSRTSSPLPPRRLRVGDGGSKTLAGRRLRGCLSRRRPSGSPATRAAHGEGGGGASPPPVARGGCGRSAPL